MLSIFPRLGLDVAEGFFSASYIDHYAGTVKSGAIANWLGMKGHEKGHGSNQGNTCTGRNPVGNALVAFRSGRNATEGIPYSVTPTAGKLNHA